MVFAHVAGFVWLATDAVRVMASIPRNHEGYDAAHWANFSTPEDHCLNFLTGLLVTVCSVSVLWLFIAAQWHLGMAISGICALFSALMAWRARQKLYAMALLVFVCRNWPSRGPVMALSRPRMALSPARPAFPLCRSLRPLPDRQRQQDDGRPAQVRAQPRYGNAVDRQPEH